MDQIAKTELDRLFGSESRGDSVLERARTSTRTFVRSQDHLAVCSESASGRRLSAWEVINAFGLDVIREADDYGTAILPAAGDEPAATLKSRREQLGLSVKELAAITGIDELTIEDAESPKTRTPIRQLEKIARAMALDERLIAFVEKSGGDSGLAYRLRDFRNSDESVPTRLISQLCEIAWVVDKQQQLQEWLKPGRALPPFEPSANYGDPSYPAWRHGYYLAAKTRDLLNIAPDMPIENLRELAEDVLGLPIVQIEFPQHIAGATIANKSARGIAVNVVGGNENVWVRRITIAHELGHLLWDPDENLRSLQVDKYDELEKAPWKSKDYVEQRANAFSVEFLAPQKAAIDVFENAGSREQGLRDVMETFGLSYTSAMYHIWNASNRSISKEELVVRDYLPTDDWKGRESFTIDFFKPDTVPITRRGKFSCLVQQAQRENLITRETASMYLDCTLDEYEEAMGFLQDICTS